MTLVTEKNIVLLHGDFKKSFYQTLKDRDIKEVYVLEARPHLDGAKKTAKELLAHGIKPMLIADNMAGFLFSRNLVKEVWVAYQSSDKKGAVTPIGSLILGVLAKKHNVAINLYPSASAVEGVGKSEDIMSFNGERTAPQNIKGYVPLTEELPQKYITGTRA